MNKKEKAKQLLYAIYGSEVADSNIKHYANVMFNILMSKKIYQCKNEFKNIFECKKFKEIGFKPSPGSHNDILAGLAELMSD